MMITRRTFRALSLALALPVVLASSTFETPLFAADGVVKMIEKALPPPPPPRPVPNACGCVRG